MLAKGKSMTIREIVDSILNPVQTRIQEQENMILGDFQLKQEVLPEGSAVVDGDIVEISIIDLKGKHFFFPGSFSMCLKGDKVTFTAKKD
jgi:hypothetical protein